MFSLKGKRALITGGSRGIGAAIAKVLAEAGADVCIGYRKRTKDAKAVAAACKALGVKGVAYASDIGTRVGAEKLVVQSIAALGEVGSVGLLERVSGMPVDELRKALRRLEMDPG